MSCWRCESSQWLNLESQRSVSHQFSQFIDSFPFLSFHFLYTHQVPSILLALHCDLLLVAPISLFAFNFPPSSSSSFSPPCSLLKPFTPSLPASTLVMAPHPISFQYRTTPPCISRTRRLPPSTIHHLPTLLLSAFFIDQPLPCGPDHLSP